MKQDKWYRLAGRYLRQYRAVALVFSGFAGIFSLVFGLYELKVEAVLYSAGLCCLFGTAVLSLHFFFYLSDHRKRLQVLKNVSLSADELPPPKTLAEEDLQEMILALKRTLEENETERQAQGRESMDYYTTWVHQVKTPLSTMKLILEGEDTEEHRELLAELFRTEQYVEMALNYLRLGSESSDYVFREYDLDAIIRQAVRRYAPLFVRRRLRLNYEPVDVKVLTDEKWLLFIIEQILSNSIKQCF